MLLYTCAQSHTHEPHKLLHRSSKPIVTKHVFCHLQTQIHSAEQPRPHTHTKDPGAEELCVRSTSHAGKTSGKELCSSKLLLNELIRHWYAKSCYKEREWEATEKRKDGRWGGVQEAGGSHKNDLVPYWHWRTLMSSLAQKSLSVQK